MRFMIGTLPMAAILLVLWLVLNDSVAPQQWLTGAVFALVLALLAPILRPARAHPGKPGLALRLILHVAQDIARSNLEVGLRILRGRRAGARPGLLDIPLRLRDPHGLAALSCIVTFTPGTVWAGHDAQHNTLTLHVLDLHDPEGLTRIIQDRYEGPLLEIFE